MPKVPRNLDIVDRHLALERRTRRRGPDRWVDLAQWMDEGYLSGDGGGFERVQLRRVGDWVEMRGHAEWDGNSNNPDPATQTYEYASALVSFDHAWSHGPLPEEFRPPGFSSISVIIDGDNSNPPDGLAATQTQAMLATSNGELLWREIDAWSTLPPNFGLYGPLTVYCFDNTRYYVGEDNVSEPPEGWVQWWPNGT